MISILDYGAVPGGAVLCTDAIRKAVAAAVAQGGGTILVPAGVYLTGGIRLESHIELHLEAGAELRFSDRPEDHEIVRTRWEGAECESYMPLIYGENLENVSVTGRGTIHGQGDAWWALFRAGKHRYPRPRTISFVNSDRVLIEGIRILRSPSWTLNPINCRNVHIHGISIMNPADSPNTDGINPESCRNVRISDCHVDVGDDCITLKSGTEACLERIPCENITVTNCTLVHGHGGVVIGSEMSGGVRNVTISNCVFEGTDRGIRIKTRRKRGGLVEDIRVNNLIMKDVICPFAMHMFYFCGEGGKDADVQDKRPAPVTGTTPVLRRIHLSNITVRNAQAAGGFFYGLPEMPIEELTLTNISVHLAENPVPGVPAMMNGVEAMAGQGLIFNGVRDLTVSNLRVENHQGAALCLTHVQGAVFSGLRADAAQGIVAQDACSDVRFS